MKIWTKNNLHEFDIEAVDMGLGQDQIAGHVESYINETATPETIQEMLDNVDSYIELACKALGWHSTPQNGGLIVNIWD